MEPFPRLIEDEEIHKVLDDMITIRHRSQIPFLFGGGVAAKSLGRQRRTKDVDVFVRPERADRLLQAFEEGGFKTERTDPTWLYKAEKDGVPIDIIFKSAGNIYIDEEMIRRATPIDFLGKTIPILPAEDLIVMKSVAHAEHSPRHWFDAVTVLATTKLDWDYLKRRAKHAPRRVIALLYYAQSLDLSVPDRVINDIIETYLR